MDTNTIHNESTFQQAIAAVEVLSIEDQTILVEIIQNRLREKRRDQLKQEIEAVRQEYKEEQVKFGSVEDFLAELDRE